MSLSRRGYLRDSRDPLNVIMLLMPLFLLYSVGILTTGGVRIGVDHVSGLLRYGLFGGHDAYYLLFNIVAALVFLAVAARLRDRQAFRPSIYLLVVLESTFYGMLLGVLVGSFLVRLGIHPPGVLALAVHAIEQLGAWESFVLSIGAGLWEEIVFRLLLLGGLVAVGKRGLRLRPLTAWTVALLVSSLAFSAIHYTGNMADTFTVYSFMFRFVAGVLFGLLYWARGLAVVVYTHAIYDIIVLVL